MADPSIYPAQAFGPGWEPPPQRGSDVGDGVGSGVGDGVGDMVGGGVGGGVSEMGSATGLA